jgi:hypothetical protein
MTESSTKFNLFKLFPCYSHANNKLRHGLQIRASEGYETCNFGSWNKYSKLFTSLPHDAIVR